VWHTVTADLHAPSTPPYNTHTHIEIAADNNMTYEGLKRVEQHDHVTEAGEGTIDQRSTYRSARKVSVLPCVSDSYTSRSVHGTNARSTRMAGIKYSYACASKHKHTQRHMTMERQNTVCCFSECERHTFHHTAAKHSLTHSMTYIFPQCEANIACAVFEIMKIIRETGLIYT
jgi:hypothetical protein